MGCGCGNKNKKKKTTLKSKEEYKKIIDKILEKRRKRYRVLY